MVRFFLGLGLGVLLTIYAFAFVGVGHGTAVPIVMTVPLIGLLSNGGAVLSLAAGPLLWALYFLLVPGIHTRRVRLTVVAAIISAHVLAGAWLAVQDPAFLRALREERLGLTGFGGLLMISMACLVYLSARHRR